MMLLIKFKQSLKMRGGSHFTRAGLSAQLQDDGCLGLLSPTRRDDLRLRRCRRKSRSCFPYEKEAMRSPLV